jgi:hypothetical protein
MLGKQRKMAKHVPQIFAESHLQPGDNLVQGGGVRTLVIAVQNKRDRRGIGTLNMVVPGNRHSQRVMK